MYPPFAEAGMELEIVLRSAKSEKLVTWHIPHMQKIKRDEMNLFTKQKHRE